MGNRSFAIALVLGLAALPLACGSDDDAAPSSGGKGGSAGSSAAAGKGGSGGKGGTAGNGGTDPGAAGEAGEGGSGNTGNVAGAAGAAGDASGGMGGDSAGGASASGSGGEGGESADPAAVRLAQCKAICNYPAQPDGPGGTAPRMQCTGDASICATNLCDTTGWSASCVKTLEDLLACLPTADPSLFYCSEFVDTPTLAGTVAVDFAAAFTCEDVSNAWTACL
jgi:hypothetical protein